MRRTTHIFLILTASLVVVSSQFAVSQNANMDLTKLPAHIKLKNSFVGVDTQTYIDAISNADFDRYRYEDKIRILKFESGVEFILLPLNGNPNAETETNYKATLKLLPSGKIVQLVPYEPGDKNSALDKVSPASTVKEAKPGINDQQSSGKPEVSYSQAPAKMPLQQNTGQERLKQLVEMRKKASETGATVDKYDKAIEALRKKLAELTNSE